MKHKFKQWIKRYLVAEVLGTLMAVGASFLSFFIAPNPIIAAYAGTWGENLGFYGTMAFKEIHTGRKHHKKNNQKYGFIGVLKAFRNLILEFGFAEIFDSFVIRPFFMFLFPVLLGNLAVGVVVGKITADIIFYIPAVIGYELRKKHIRN